ncbi:MAG: sigma 54-interacting transcriptional regulator [Firmicutes bacterium]|nr:sigma 54-interacting transcriptional regulator [Bacillota bacterium]
MGAIYVTNKIEDMLHILEAMVENPYMGIIFVNTEGRLLLINQTYCDILEKKKEEVVGRHILDVTPNSGIMEVIRTGRTDIADLWSIKGHDMVVTRMPIYENGVMIGAMAKSLFLDVSAAKVLVKKLELVEQQLAGYREEIKSLHQAKYSCSDLVGSSDRMAKVKLMARQACKSISNVLISGDTGTGKELLANAIHNASCRARQPFVRVNCGALPHNLLESELFGYEEGAFTGAKKGGKPGRFELAHHGTVFLNEIGEMPLEMQTRLLTFLQEKEFERVGGTKTIKVDVRIIAATNRDLEQAVLEGRFREDLYYRLNVLSIYIPPLRKRLEDIPELVSRFISQLNARLGTAIKGVSSSSMDLLQSYDWPGNVRELENLLERAIHVADMNEETLLELSHFSSLARKLNRSGGPQPAKARSLYDTVCTAEKAAIEESLLRNNGDKAEAAKELGIHITVLYRKIKKYGINQTAESA